MSNPVELLKEICTDLECDSKLPMWLRDKVRAFLDAEPETDPVAWMFQHEDTGLIDYVDTQQVEWGFEKNNPRWQKDWPRLPSPTQT